MENDTTRNIAELAFMEARRLKGDANIVAVGYGIKLRQGLPQGGPCVQYLVRKKLAQPELFADRTTAPVPAQVGGFTTDVIETGAVVAAVSDRAPPAGGRGSCAYDNLQGGVATAGLGSTSAGPGGFGTLGGFCFDVATGTPLGLSSAHVWGPANTEVIQPLLPASVAKTKTEVLDDAGAAVVSRIPDCMRAVVAFANAETWARLLSVGLNAGEVATPVAADVSTTTERVSVETPGGPGLPPAGREHSVASTWKYQRTSTAGVFDAEGASNLTNQNRLRIQTASTNASSYSASQVITINAEIAGYDGSDYAESYFLVAHVYVASNATKVVRRFLRKAASQPTDPGRGIVFEGTLNASELGRGQWAVTVVVQKTHTGQTVSANTVTNANGAVVLKADATFSIV